MYRELFESFFRIGILSFGGGYAMLPLLEREIVNKRGWATEEELADCYAVGQCTPGIIMVNTATFIGYKKRGVFGGVFATLSAILPAFCILLVIAALLQGFSEYAVVKNAFAGIRVAVVVLTVCTVVKLFRTSVIDRASRAIFVLVLFLSLLLPVSPVVFVLAAGVTGVVLRVWGRTADR